MDIEKLSIKGFDNRQISQIIFINELGIDLSNINIDISVDILKNFKNKLKNKEIDSSEISALKDLIEAEGNITNLLSGKLDYLKLKSLYWFASNKYDISNVSKEEYSNKNLEHLKDIYENTKKAYELLEDPKISPSTLYALGNVAKYSDFNLNKYLPYIKNFEQLDSFSYIADICMKEKLDIPDISILFDDNYNWKQKNEILNGLAHGVDITQYCDETFDDKQMSCIRQGLINGVDVTLYNKKRYTAEQMDAILEFQSLILDGEIDFNINLICNHKYSPECMYFLGEKLANGEDISIYIKNDYDINQMHVLCMGLEYDVDISQYEDPNLSGREMYVIFNGLKMLSKGVDISVLKSNLSIKEKIDYLINFTSIKNLKNIDSLDIKLNSKMENINDFYDEYDEEERDYAINIYTNDDKILISEKEKYIDIDDIKYYVKTDEDDSYAETFMDEYENEVKDMLDLITFVEINDGGATSVNLYTGEKLYFIDFNFFDNNINEVIEDIIEETIECLKYHIDYGLKYGSFFDSLDEMEACGIIKPSRLVWTYDFNLFSDFAFITEKELQELGCLADDESLKKMFINFEDECEKLYACWAEDVHNVKLFDKDFNLLDEKIIYGSYNIENKLSKEFNVEKIKKLTRREGKSIEEKIEELR